ncbi:MAG: hypothetical protein NTW60_02470 [Candidatus Wolfebacteria bacterium]|nr:hypothetical protein [Candidatus Wolfebacteria bacterium]
MNMRAYIHKSKSNESSNIWQDCHLCGKTILKSALATHLQEFHSCAAASKSSGGSKSSQTDFDEDYEEGDYELKDYVTETHDGMDGSKYCGFPVRDYGSQYGSYPIHDDHGDESGPD